MKRFSIPEKEPAATQHFHPSASPDEPRPRPLRILLLEDAAGDAELMQRELRKGQILFDVRCVEKRGTFPLAHRKCARHHRNFESRWHVSLRQSVLKNFRLQT